MNKIDLLGKAENLGKLLKKYQELKCLEYNPFEYQLQVHRCSDPIIFLQAGNQVGKSLAACREMIFWFRGHHPYKKLPKTRNLVIWAVTETLTMAIESIYERKLKQMIPSNEYREIKEMSQLVAIEHKLTKNRIYFKAMAKGSSRLQSVPVDLLVIDEMPPDFKTFSELMMRTRASKGQILMTFTPLKVNLEIRNFIESGEAGVKVFKVTAYDCPMFTTEEIDKARRTYPESVFKSRFLAEWASYQGVLLPSFGDAQILPKEEEFDIPQHWQKVVAVDPASSGYTGICLIARDQSLKDPTWYVFKEAMVENISPEQLVDFIENFIGHHKVDARYCDVHESWFIKTARAQKDILYQGVKKFKKEDMTVELDTAFARGDIKIFESCQQLIKQAVSYVNKDEVQDFDPIRGDFHILDALIYANLMFKSLPRVKQAEEELSPLWKMIKKSEKKKNKIFTESI